MKISPKIEETKKDFLDHKINIQKETELFEELKHINHTLQDKINHAIEEIRKKDKKMQEQSKFVQLGKILSMIAYQWRQALAAISSSIIHIQTILEIGKFDLCDKNGAKEFENFLGEKLSKVDDHVQLILNILKNSEENFLGQDKEKRILIKTYKEKDQNIISICDNGGGIDDKILKKIYDPYFSTKSDKNGTGLGLYMSKIIIEEHHF